MCYVVIHESVECILCCSTSLFVSDNVICTCYFVWWSETLVLCQPVLVLALIVNLNRVTEYMYLTALKNTSLAQSFSYNWLQNLLLRCAYCVTRCYLESVTTDWHCFDATLFVVFGRVLWQIGIVVLVLAFTSRSNTALYAHWMHRCECIVLSVNLC